MKTRKFTRYSTDIPIFFSIDNMIGKHRLYLKDISQGGLCFNAHGCIDRDTHLEINIPLSGRSCEAVGKVAWCQPSNTGECLLGTTFEKQVTQSDLEKMVHRH